MSALEKISFSARATAPELCLRVCFDGQEIFCQQLSTDDMQISHEFDDDVQGPHQLEIEMSGKTRYHTKLDPEGNIMEDRCIEISDIEIGGIALGHVLTQTSVYEHDTNGTAAKQQHRFYGIMGCNGVVTLRFTSPIYLWLLENL